LLSEYPEVLHAVFLLEKDTLATVPSLNDMMGKSWNHNAS
jgi:hypothetical protein